jgi:hypothetical protein
MCDNQQVFKTPSANIAVAERQHRSQQTLP